MIEFGAELWIILKKMHQTACNRSQSSQNENDPKQNKGGGNDQMRKQFEVANAFFIQKITEFNSSNQNMFKGVLEMLETEAYTTKSKKSAGKKAENGDGLSSQ